MQTRKVLCLSFLVCVYLCSLSYANALPPPPRQGSAGFETDIDISELRFLTAEEKEKIAQNGFVIFIPRRSAYYPEDEAVGIYRKCKQSHFPVFVTSDVILHVSHLLFDWSLRFLEISTLKQDLLNLTDAMLTESLAYHEQIDGANSVLQEAALKNAIYFCIAKSLLTESNLDEVPNDIKGIIEKELGLIAGHEGFAESPLFGYREDYSQYIPRGHYARSPEFEKYFKTMMWYGRMSFRLSPVKEVNGEFVLDKSIATAESLQALLICKALTDTKVKGETAPAVWKRIYETTSFFAGRSDDLTVEDYIGQMDKVYGKGCPLDALSNEEKVTEFTTQCRRLRKPQILSTYVTDVSSRAMDWKEQTQGLNFMGQRFTPDSHIFQNLVYDEVKWYTGKDPKPFTAVSANGRVFRGFPRGLDIMAVFGSKLAADILREENDTSFEGYDEQFLQLKKNHERLGSRVWKQNLYWSRIYAAKSILEAPGRNAPAFMQSGAWLKKQLNTALGCWTELKHDTIVYTKQPYSEAQAAFSVMGKGGSLPPETVHGYVEPVPQLYARVRQSVESLRLKLTSLGFPSDLALENNFKTFERLLTSLEDISKKELSGQTPTDAEYKLIEDIGYRLRWILRAAHYMDVTEKFRSKMDNKMSIVADVFTQTNSGEVLEQGVGKPAEIFVIARVDGKEKVCLGVAYSYYEFKQPAGQRLTDEKWRSMIKGKDRPSIPEWMEEIAVVQK